MSIAEALLWILLACLFLRKGLQKALPAMGSYLVMMGIGAPLLFWLMYEQAHHGHSFYSAYFYSYWAVYAASTIFVYFIGIEIFIATIINFPILLSVAKLIFRAAAALGILIFFADLRIEHTAESYATAIFRFSTFTSVLQVCLLVFLFTAAKSLRLSLCSPAFGIALGFALLGLGEFLTSTVLPLHLHSLIDFQQVIREIGTLGSLGIWIAYTAWSKPPEEIPQEAGVPAMSRWTAIAQMVGHAPAVIAGDSVRNEPD